MNSAKRPPVRENLALAGVALRMWTRRKVVIAAIATVVVALVIGFATVLIPNPVFGRDVPPVWWNYPVWLLSSVLMGMLVATYFGGAASEIPEAAEGAATSPSEDLQAGEKRTTRLGAAGGVLAWFAVGCPVCNKIALLALGYGGALTWFAPVQPWLGVAALVLTAFALVVRLRGEAACPVPSRVTSGVA
ncbi:MAG TPA: hypothetical protein VFC82_06405 [Actinomycetaceae bacterium]|nr:hypothetical protein [Actinomycetaceae bacterium]